MIVELVKVPTESKQTEAKRRNRRETPEGYFDHHYSDERNCRGFFQNNQLGSSNMIMQDVYDTAAPWRLPEGFSLSAYTQ